MRRTCCFLLALFGILAAAMPSRAALLFNTNATWNLFKGRSEASSPDVTAWRQLDFNDSTWTQQAPSPFWYGDTFPGGTQVPDMATVPYTTLYLRRSVVIGDAGSISGLRLGYHCDDGFVIWINGVELFRYNAPAGNLAFNAVAASSVGEPVQFTTADVTVPAGMLVDGTNLVAVLGLNASATSSDFGLNLSLSTIAPDSTPPTIATVSPAPGVTGELNAITVTFSEPVSGVDAADLRLNGVPATGLTGGNDTYTFTFPAQPYGVIAVTWAPDAGVADFGVPPNAFNPTGPGATWQYDYKDNIAPTITFQLPFAGTTVRALAQLEVNFSEPVTGVEPADLLINGVAATGMSTPSPGRVIFTFPPLAPGPVQVAFADGHGITDFAAVPNAFAGANWSYTVDPNVVVAAVRINEIATANLNGLRDEDNQAQDWIELYNTSASTVSLAGWTLTDDAQDSAKWVFPAVSIGARGYLVVFCSGKDRKPVTPGSRLHTNFKLSPDGEFLGLYNAEVPRQLVSSFDPYPNQRNDYSYGYDNLDQLRYFQVSSPGVVNGASTITGVVADTKFSHNRGFYDTNFSLSITCATPGVTIRYTTNGVAPTATTGSVYSSPIPVTGTKIVRAAAFKTGLLPSDVDAQTYFFVEDIIRQPDETTPGPGWPAQNKTGGGQKFDYGMDRAITVSNATWAALIRPAMKAIPSFSIVMDIADFSSIYSNPGGDTIAWERPASVELVYPDDTQGFQANCGIRIRGGFSRSTDNPKHAFRIFFRQEYGVSKLNYPVFGPTGASSFDKFDLRTMQNYSWAFQGDSSMMCFRDVSSRDAQLAMNGLGTRGNFYHLYINGVYWGLYNSEERPEAAFAESYVGGNADDYDTIKQLDGYLSGATDGNNDAWYRLWQAATNGFANDADYFKVQGLNLDGTPNPAYENLVDVPNMIDYMLVILYGGNLDAPISNFLGNDSPNNWYGFRDRTGQHGGFRFVSHDAEHTLLNVGADRTGIVDLSATGGQYGVIDPDWTCGNPLTQSGGAAAAIQRSTPQYVWFRMHQNAEFRMLAADRIQRHCFNGGPLSVEGMRAALLTRSNEIQLAIVAESARWGDAKVAIPYTRDTWRSAFSSVFTGFVPGRTGTLINQLRADGLFPTVNAPSFSAPGGAVPAGFQVGLTINNPSGTIYYTVDGSDPRVRGGNVSANAIAYTPGTPVVINVYTVLRARVRSGSTWSPITEATYFPSQDFRSLRFTEIMFNPPAFGPVPADDVEFIELKNAGETVLDLGGLSFSEGVSFTFTNRTKLGPGQFFVLARNPAALVAKYPGLVVHGTYAGRLDNGGESLTLSTPLGSQLVSFSYKDSGRWPLTPDGVGHSLVARSTSGLLGPGNPAYWRASTNPGGSPGADDPAPTIPGIVINEALTHTDPPLVDYIELHNPTAAAVDLAGWFLTDSAAFPKKFQIPADTMIEPGGYRVFTEADFNPTPGVGNSFTLDSHGEEVYVLSGDLATGALTGYSHGFSFGAAENGVAFGRHVLSNGDDNFVAQLARTPAEANSGPQVGPVVISQIMYHPPDLAGGLDDSQNEFIELRNITTAAVALRDPLYPTNGWRIRGGVSFDFPLNTVIGPTQSVLIVNFSSADAATLAAFRSKYGGFVGVPIFGPYSGKLNNSSDRIELQRPDAPDTNGVPRITVDEVNYQDAAPWAPSADGGGAALRRIDVAAYGNDPANWIGFAPLTIVGISPANIVVRPGTSPATATNVTFAVAAYGTGDLTYQWRKDSVVIPGAISESYTVVDVQARDEGAYSVDVTDASGTVTSSPAYLQLLIVPVIVQPPISQTVVAGKPFTLSTVITGSPFPFTYEWRLGSAGLNTNVSNERFDFVTFVASNVATSLTYRVVVKNAANNAPGVSHTPQTVITVLADTDQDGLPDVWETAAGLNPASAADALLDLDGDGVRNVDEYIAGTDPKDASSYLKVEQPAGPAMISFVAVANRTYTIQFTDDLGTPWQRLAHVPARAVTGLITINDPNVRPQRVYRLVTPQLP